MRGPMQLTDAHEKARRVVRLARARQPTSRCEPSSPSASAREVPRATPRRPSPLDQLAVPFVVCHDSAVPAFVGPDCLVVVVACGDTPETSAAARQSEARGARVVGIGNDAAAGAARRRRRRALVRSGCGRSAAAAPRFGPATVSLLGALSAAGLLPDCSAEVAAAAELVARRRDVFVAAKGNAAELARRIGRTIPLVYGSSGIAAVAARWWKSCVNLNAKSPAFAAELPGLTYDELAGWGQGGDITRQTMTLVFLRHRASRRPFRACSSRCGPPPKRSWPTSSTCGRTARTTSGACSSSHCWVSSSRWRWPPAKVSTPGRFPRSRRPTSPSADSVRRAVLRVWRR